MKTIPFIIILLFSCSSPVFEEDLPKVLGVPIVEIKSHKRIDVSGGIRKSYLLEIYELSPLIVSDFLKGNKELPLKSSKTHYPWFKSGWHNTPLTEDSLFQEIAPIVLISDWGSSELKEELTKINKSISGGNIYYGYYYKAPTTQPNYVQMYILDTLSNTLYIMDSNM